MIKHTLARLRESADWCMGRRRYFSYDSADGRWLYPLSFRSAIKATGYRTVRTGDIPVSHYKGLGLQYNPTTVAMHGLEDWNVYQQSQSSDVLAACLAKVSWLRANQQDGKWYFRFDFKDLKAPWISCISQGVAISLLLRGHKIDPQPDDMAIIKRALLPFTQPVSEGGLLSQLPGGDIFLEEYPGSAVFRYVLNGCLYAVISLIECARHPELAEMVSPLLGELRQSLVRHIREWDMGFWTSYTLVEPHTRRRTIASLKYQDVHIHLLSFIARELQAPELAAMAEKWQRQRDSTPIRLWAFCYKCYGWFA